MADWTNTEAIYQLSHNLELTIEHFIILTLFLKKKRWNPLYSPQPITQARTALS